MRADHVLTHAVVRARHVRARHMNTCKFVKSQMIDDDIINCAEQIACKTMYKAPPLAQDLGADTRVHIARACARTHARTHAHARTHTHTIA